MRPHLPPRANAPVLIYIFTIIIQRDGPFKIVEHIDMVIGTSALFSRRYQNWNYEKNSQKKKYWKKYKIPIKSEFRAYIVTSDLDSFIRKKFNFFASNDVVIRRILLRHKNTHSISQRC